MDLRLYREDLRDCRTLLAYAIKQMMHHQFRKGFTQIVIVLIVGMLSSCLTMSTSSGNTTFIPKSFGGPEESIIYVYRTDSFWTASISLLVNGKQTCVLDPRTYTAVRLSPGDYTLSIDCPQDPRIRYLVIDLQVLEQREYFARTKLILGPSARFEIVENSLAIQELTGLNEIQPRVSFVSAARKTSSLEEQENLSGLSGKLPIVGVLDIVSESGVSAADSGFITDFIIDSLVFSRRDNYEVIARAIRDELLIEQEFGLSDACDSLSCAIEAGKLLSATHIVFGRFGQFGNNYFLTLQIVNIETAQISSSVRAKSENLDGIESKIQESVSSLISGLK